jgi:hypothetical protein
VQHGVATLSFAHNAGDEDLEVDAFVVAADGREMARGKFKTGRNGNEISDLDVSNLMKGVSKLMGRLYILHCEVTAGNRKGKFSCKFVAAAQ